MRTFAEHKEQATKDELEVAEAFRSRRGLTAGLSQKFCPFDIYLRDAAGKELVGIVEVKRRNLEWGLFPTIHISQTKIENCLTLSHTLNVPFYLVIICRGDALWMVRIKRSDFAEYHRKLGGRRDRFLKKDHEVLVDIPIENFESL